MQTPKSSSSGAAPLTSPQSISSEASNKHSPRIVRQLKTSPRFLEPTISSSKLATKPPKERSPRVSDHNSPSSPHSEKKRPTKVSELESQISQLEKDLKNVKDQLILSETSKKQAQKYAEESNQQLLVFSSKLEESEKKLLELSASYNSPAIGLSETTEGQDTSLQAELEDLKSQQLQESAALASALDEIQRLKAQLEMVAESGDNNSESARNELDKLNESLSVVEEMKKELSKCKKSEAQAQELVGETLMQLEAAKKMVEALRSDGCKATEGYEAAASELEQSRARVKLLEELVSKLKSENDLETDFASLKLEVEQLRSALAVAEIRQNEDQARSSEQVKQALEMEQIKSASGRREAELEVL